MWILGLKGLMMSVLGSNSFKTAVHQRISLNTHNSKEYRSMTVQQVLQNQPKRTLRP